MNDFKKRLQHMKTVQDNLAKEYEAVLNEYESHDLIQENQTLRRDYEEYKLRVGELKQKQKEIEAENAHLRSAIKDQIVDEKLNILKVSQEKLNTYFRSATQPAYNKLYALEQESRQEVDRLVARTTKNLQEEKQEILAKLEQISAELNAKVILHIELLDLKEKDMLHGVSEGYDQLSKEEITEEVIQKRAKQNQLEMKIGLNWINKLGILLIIFGVGAAFKHSYSHFLNDYFKGIMFFVLGGLMLAGGEYLYRKNKQTFALGVIGGGIAILYGSIFFSYFLLEIIEMPAALLLSVLVTLLAIVLSLRYDSRTVCSFGLVGGYFPLYSYIIAFDLQGAAVYAAMGYLVLLTLSILIVSFRKKWNVVHYISFLLNIPSMIVLILLSSSDTVNMGYAAVTFIIYLGITLGYSFKHKVSLSKLDVALLAINTTVSCIVLYYLFDELELTEYRGLLALAFSLIYLLLARFMVRIMKHEKQTLLLFYGTSLTFAILIIPFQFGVHWLSLGWLIEALILMAFGHSVRIKSLEKSGWMVFLLCLGAFYIEVLAIVTGDWNPTDFFNLKYTSIMLGLLLVMIYYLLSQKKLGAHSGVFRNFSEKLTTFKYFTLANLWIYLIYESMHFYHQFIPQQYELYHFYEVMVLAFISIGLAYALTKAMLLYDRIVKYYALFLYSVGCLIGLYVTVKMPLLNDDMAQNSYMEYLALGILIAFNGIVFFSGRGLLIAFIRQQYKNIELYPFILAIYLLGISAAFLNVQLQLGDVGFISSIVYLGLAISYILYGFRKRYVYIRRLGLALTLLSTGKLFLIDLAYLAEGSKILAYFCFGVALLGISFIYQRVSNKLEELPLGAKK
ncbi:DUF2339 domain-containing protein [Paenibacillus psychroresistens]|uniref:DUF2339 domain-containing protein n=1 Tax=Paenibacillus psychroresistens TaxID=1778678 RepID=A0A6B8RS44_9BACL|nr:DUF2339 domain-containing protein [Paenibacillus psychroresistens]QGQ98572.1 DUF2339 domain-containing protein [Paenibacillus psychroresistens]